MSALSKLTAYKPHRSQTNPDIRRLLSTHYHYLKNHESTRVLTVDHDKATPFYYHFFAYLQATGIPREIHYCTLLLTDLLNPGQFDRNTVEIIVPDMVVVETIIAESGL